MRILEVIQEMQAGGAERVVLSLASGAEAAGDAVAIAAAPGALDVECPLPEVRAAADPETPGCGPGSGLAPRAGAPPVAPDRRALP